MMSQHDDEMQDVLDALSKLAPTVADSPRPASQALARLKQQFESQRRASSIRRLSLMSRRSYAFATLIIVLFLVAAFSFPGVRAAASDFLGLFRVQKFAPISISPEQLALLEEVAQSGLYPGEIEMIEEPGEPQRVESLSEAEAFSGWPVRVPGELGVPDQVYTMDGGGGRLVVNVESARALMKAAGADPNLIPDSLEGAAVELTVYPSVSLNWNKGIVLLQAPSPLVEYPEDVDAVALGEALLQALGMESSQASHLARSIDWTNTLLLPIPENMASFSEVDVDGVSGLALNSVDGRNSALLWQKDGIVYALSGAETAELRKIANSLP